ncbi:MULTISPECIES: hypothetical protein [unclassified Leucobacter]|nr:hypothetical protein XM48_14510 [Leucobacter sp. Ag1]
MTRATIAIAAALAATLALAGCSGDGKKKNEPEEGPLAKYLSALYDESAWTEDRMEADHKKMEKVIAECMTKEGFEYKPAPYQGGTVFNPEDDEGPQMGTMEFAKQYGYGIIDSPWQQSIDEQNQDQPPADPNQKYLESLSESEQMAYSETLYGPQPTAEEMAAMEEGDGAEPVPYDWKKAGCQGKAQHEVQGEQSYEAASKDPAYTELLKSVDEFWQKQYENNDALDALDRKWADCMSKAGFSDAAKRNDAQSKLNDEWNEAMSQGQPADDSGEWKEPSKAEKKKFQEREIEVAVADITCAEKMQYDDKAAALNLKAEQKFVDEHEKQLKALVAQYGVKKK